MLEHDRSAIYRFHNVTLVRYRRECRSFEAIRHDDPIYATADPTDPA